MKTKKYFNRIFGVCVALCAAFSLLFSLTYYITSAKRIYTDFCADKQIQTANESAALEQIFKMCEKSAQYSAKNIDYTPASFQNALQSTQDFFDFGSIYVMDENKTVYKKDDSFFLDASVREKLAAMKTDFKLFSFSEGGREYIAIANRINTDNKKIYFLRAAEKGEFLRAGKINSDSLVFLSDTNAIYLGSEKYFADMKSHINEKGAQSVFSNILGGEYKGKDCVYTAAQSEYIKNAGEVFIYSTASVSSKYAELALICVAVFFIVLILLSLLCFAAAKIAYHPIDELNALAVRYTNESDSADEVAHISSALKAMAEKINVLKADAQKKQQLLRERFVKDLLSGIVGEDSYASYAEEFFMAEYETPFYAGVFEIADYESLSEVFGERNLLQIKKQICSFIDNELMGRSIQSAVEIDKKRFAVVTYGCDVSRIHQNFSYIVSVINGEFDVEMIALIGSRCDNLFYINESYANCVKALDESGVLGFRGTVISYDDIETKANFYYPVNLERDLISSVIRLKREESMRIINNILDENLNGKTLTKEKHNAIIFAFTATINRIVEAINKTVDEVYGKDNIVFLELKMCDGAPALRAKVIQCFDKILNYMSGDEDADMSKRLMDYIHSHYNEDISLTEIGAYFKRSKCYISTVFKETTGENFKDYLSRYRIKKAKEILLKNPNIKNKELAAMIGCNTPATLFRLFNKYENMSPGQFAKNGADGKGGSEKSN